MINRRSFLGSFGASSLLMTAPAFSAAQTESIGNGSRVRLSLNGEWEYRIAGELQDKITVPSSRRPTGYYSLDRSIVLPRLVPGRRTFVHCEAITYWGRITVNGRVLGSTLPYIPSEFEFTDVAQEGDNAIRVEIADLVPFPDGSGKTEIALGVNRGWEAYGGIIRDIWAEIRPASFIDNVRFAYSLSENYLKCSGHPRMIVKSLEATSCVAEIILRNRGAEAARDRREVHLKPGVNEIELTFDLNNPDLWSPELPNLYELSAYVKTASGEDRWSCQTGFRDLRASGRDFQLNGRRLVLNGVCRHDMWKDQGFTLTRRQQEQDMRMIKELGCNCVRLVHYPHDRHIVELADQLGLLVSEEPGFWNMDLSTMEPDEVEDGYRILEATIQRDWNSPSVFAWLLSNECFLTEKFLAEGKRRCNEFDPIRRMVSAANNKKAETVKPLFVAAEMDFFDQHIYTYQLGKFSEHAVFYGSGKPLTLSEWGGRAIAQSGQAMPRTVDTLIGLIESGDLSGTMFWSWADLPQFSRIDREMCNGILESGVVSEAREPRDAVWMELARLFELRRPTMDVPARALELLPLEWVPWSARSTFSSVNLQPLLESADAALVWSNFNKRMGEYWKKREYEQRTHNLEGGVLWSGGDVAIMGVNFSVPVIGGHARPLILSSEVPKVRIPINRVCRRVHILGQVTFPDGFPVVGKSGDVVATYVLEYFDGATQEIPLRNGYEVARSNLIRGASRIEPIATEAQPALLFVKDIAREQYQVLLLSLPADAKKLESVQCKVNGDQALPIFAITVEEA